MAEKLRFHVQVLVQENLLGHVPHAIEDVLGAAEDQGTQYGAPAGKGNLQVFENREVAVDGRRLELPAHAQVDNLVLGELGQILLLEFDLARGGLGPAADEIQNRGLPRSVGPDYGPELMLVDVQVEGVHGLETIEGHRQVFYGEQDFVCHGLVSKGCLGPFMRFP
jgi:hypothetical protein